jgi:hypothetical protein
MKHTKEPWCLRGVNIDSDNSDVSVGCCYKTHSVGQTPKSALANAKRIIACVNACAGMEEPAMEIPALKAELERLRDALSKAHAIIAKGGKP